MRRGLSIILACVILLSCGFAMPLSVSADEDTSSNPLKGVKVAFYGDSITAANRENRIGWAGRVGDANQMIWVNHGQGGWAISNIRGDTVTICQQLMNTDVASYDMILLHGGTNDAWSNAPLGRMSEQLSAYQSYSPLTFAGGLERTFAYVREKNPDAIVGFIINFKFLNASDGATVQVNGKTEYLLNHMEAYVEMTKQICDKWEIPYLDLYSNDALTKKLHPLDVTGRYSTKYLFDFIHPSPEGYDLLTPYIEDFMVDLITAPKTTEEETTEELVPEIETEENETKANETETQDSTERAKQFPFGCNAVLSEASGMLACVALSGGALLCRRGRTNNRLLDRPKRTVKKKIKVKGGESL